MVLDLPLFQQGSITATSDSVFRLIPVDKWAAYVDIFVYDYDCYLGDRSGQDIIIVSGDIYEIPYPVNLANVFIKNRTAGQNTRIVYAYLELSEPQFKRLAEGGTLALR